MLKALKSLVLLYTIFQSWMALAGGGGGGPTVFKEFRSCEVANNPNLTIYFVTSYGYNSEYDSQPSDSNTLISIESRDGKKLLLIGSEIKEWDKMKENQNTLWLHDHYYPSPLVKAGDKTIIVATNIIRRQFGTFKAIAKESGTIIIDSEVRCGPSNRKW